MRRNDVVMNKKELKRRVITDKNGLKKDYDIRNLKEG